MPLHLLTPADSCDIDRCSGGYISNNNDDSNYDNNDGANGSGSGSIPNVNESKTTNCSENDEPLDTIASS